LGLQLVMLLTRQLRGDISLDRDHGTAFKLLLPYNDEGLNGE
jgi:two-component sensor histidine kinase